MTNGDKIRQMSDEEWAKYIGENYFCECCPLIDGCRAKTSDDCRNKIIEWLKQEERK